jgi:Immunity protein 44
VTGDDEMKFWFSAEIDSDVGEAQRLISNAVEAALNDALSAVAMGDGVAKWYVIFMISKDAHKVLGWPERQRYTKRDSSFEFRLKIDHAAFAAADDAAKRRMMLEVILGSIEWAKAKHKSVNFDYDKLRSVVEDTSREKGWLPGSR